MLLLVMKMYKNKNKKIILLDFDGTLHKYTTKFTHETHIHDEPIDGAIQFVKDLFDAGFQVVIFSSRGSHSEFGLYANDWFAKYGLDKCYIDMLQYSNVKGPHDVILDDRAWNFDGNYPEVSELMAFRPWNKR